MNNLTYQVGLRNPGVASNVSNQSFNNTPTPPPTYDSVMSSANQSSNPPKFTNIPTGSLLGGSAGMNTLHILSGGTAGAGANSNNGPGGGGGLANNNSILAQQQFMDEEKIYQLILDLTNPATREAGLLELSKKREAYEDLAPILWHSFGVMAALLQEIVSVYPMLSPPTLTGHASNRGTVLDRSYTPVSIPILEYYHLGVIGALVKNDNSEVINFLLSTEIIPLCLRIMETGSELSKTVAIFIVQKILLDDMGLNYICQTYERFYAVGTVLSNMVAQLVEQQSIRLLKHVIRCYLRLSDNPRAREALRQCLPEPLRDILDLRTVAHHFFRFYIINIII
ncbi:hypothetical protein SeMB42_g07550 [Synchytrium endobioticum]|uniref:Cell differentiation protein rcd1 n=1 Tax=Synchytrium endobioticum TaxID=286115 RepID=A0A507BZT1_9FUNG|nr:hypothetical protein SeMB42_g07550 [Synchytrium endobioticum]